MPVAQGGPFSVMERFPGDGERIVRLFREKESFRTICADYEKCLQTLRYWSASEAEHAAARREEYTAMLEDLEAEISEQLDAPEKEGE